MPWNVRDENNKEWVGYNTEQQTNFIKSFLVERRDFLTITHIEKHLKIKVHELQKIMDNNQVTLNPVTIEIVSKFLSETFGFEMPLFQYTIKDILKIISRLSKIPVETLTKKTKKRAIVEERYIAMFLYVELNHIKREKYEIIGHEFGGFDHSTVSHALKTISNLMETNSCMRNKVENYSKEIKGQNNLIPNLTE